MNLFRNLIDELMNLIDLFRNLILIWSFILNCNLVLSQASNIIFICNFGVKFDFNFEFCFKLQFLGSNLSFKFGS